MTMGVGNQKSQGVVAPTRHEYGGRKSNAHLTMAVFLYIPCILLFLLNTSLFGNDPKYMKYIEIPPGAMAQARLPMGPDSGTRVMDTTDGSSGQMCPRPGKGEISVEIPPIS